MSSIGKKVPTQEEIEQRAYQIYLQRGGSHGGEVDGWLAAEKELTESLPVDAYKPTVPEEKPLRKRATAS